MNRWTLPIIAFLAASLLAACGQTGALYLPDHPPPLHGIGPAGVTAVVNAANHAPGSRPTASNVKSNELRDQLTTAVPTSSTIPAQPVPAGGIGSPLPPSGP